MSFHRRIMPWIFILAFLIIAPTVVFYTSGYRWNPKKGRVERSSTVIIDSIPAGADVAIDGRPTEEKTPVTIQNMAPGIHRLLVSKPGYHPWEKSLDVRPELVTFANSIQLWKEEEPSLGFPEPSRSISVSPDERFLLRFIDVTSTTALVTNLSSLETTRIAFSTAIPLPLQASWSDSNRFILLEPRRSGLSSWLLDVRNEHVPLELPHGRYRWEGTRLVGNDGKNLIELRTPQMSIQKTILGSGIADRTDEAELRSSTETSALIYVLLDKPDRGLILPPGNWQFWSKTRAFVMLRDGDTWLAIQDRAINPEYHAVKGDMLRAPPASSLFRITAQKQDQFIIVNGGELWNWNPLQEPELLLRQSENIVDAAWHHEGNDVFYTTAHGVFALNLDPRDGHIITPLAEFDEITDLAAINGQLQIAGTKNAEVGVWTLPVE